MTKTQPAPEAWTIEQTAGLFPHIDEDWPVIEETYRDMRARTIAASPRPGVMEEDIQEHEELYWKTVDTPVTRYARSVYGEGEIEEEQLGMVRRYVAVNGLTRQISSALETVHSHAPAEPPADYDPSIQGTIKIEGNKQYTVRMNWQTGDSMAYRIGPDGSRLVPFPENQQDRAKELISKLAITQLNRRNMERHTESVRKSKAFLGRLGIIGKPLAERRIESRSRAKRDTPLHMLYDVVGNEY